MCFKITHHKPLRIRNRTRKNKASSVESIKTINLSVDYSDQLVFCKQNLEACFVADFPNKLKSYREELHSKYQNPVF